MKYEDLPKPGVRATFWCSAALLSRALFAVTLSKGRP